MGKKLLSAVKLMTKALSVRYENSSKLQKIFFRAIAAWVVVILLTLLVMGYRPASDLTYTKDEMIRISIERTMKNILTYPGYPVIEIPEQKDGWGKQLYRPAARVIPYKSVEHFLEENPECCAISYENDARVIDVSANVFYLDNNGEIRKGDKKAEYTEYFKKSSKLFWLLLAFGVLAIYLNKKFILDKQ